MSGDTTEVVVIANFQERTLQGHVAWFHAKAEGELALGIHPWIQIQEVLANTVRLDFEAKDQQLRVHLPSTDSLKLEVQFVVHLPAMWHDVDDQRFLVTEEGMKAMDLLPGPRPAWDLTSHDLLHMTYLQKVFTYDRCCRVPFTEISQMLLSRWPALARAQERWPARLKSTRRGRWRWRALADLAAQQLERDGDFISAVAELLVFYTWRLRANRAAASRDFDRSSRTVELRTWRRLRRAMEAQRVQRMFRSLTFNACGVGYDMLMAMRDNIKRLWLHHANFSKQMAFMSHVDVTLQFLSEERTNCVSGDVASNIAVAQACILQGRWDRAADLLLLAFALVVLAPWRDCGLSLSFWDITADDVVYNAARLASMSSNNAKQRPQWLASRQEDGPWRWRFWDLNGPIPCHVPAWTSQ
ncbi:Tropomodulin-2 [Durusdinium trenchii]|uniref:Tropomodulin-2 n=1 Tax=Durusdinium trenchii TaxID=1381693 RepID=A0ABP0LSZ2_9DINO